jgi:hypothetical protein
LLYIREVPDVQEVFQGEREGEMRMLGKRSKKRITYHGRPGYPVVHTAKNGRKYIMVRARGGGTKRLYEGSLYRGNGKIKRLKL